MTEEEKQQLIKDFKKKIFLESDSVCGEQMISIYEAENILVDLLG